MFCKHKWKILSETTTKSKMEHAKDLGESFTGRLHERFLKRYFIQILTCEKCGKLKRYVEKI